jgi:RNA 2',3'-cyclic 3'-phosphodiesterase
VRVFAAVELPGEVRARIAAAARALLDGVRAAKPVREENLHVTIRFVGEVADAAVDPLCAAVRDAASSVARGSASARGVGAFPDARRPRVVWVGLDDPGAVLTAVEVAISARLGPLGYRREERPFSAHVTVARMREGARDLSPLSERLAAAAREAPAFGAVPVDAVTVFKSDLTSDGSRYTALARFPLSET